MINYLVIIYTAMPWARKSRLQILKFCTNYGICFCSLHSFLLVTFIFRREILVFAELSFNCSILSFPSPKLKMVCFGDQLFTICLLISLMLAAEKLIACFVLNGWG